MKPISTSLAAIATIALFSIASIASAEEGRPPIQPGLPTTQMQGRMEMEHGTSSMKHEGEMRDTPKPVAGVLGLVTAVNSNSFTMNARLKDATTSVTVNVTSSTTYRVGSTTGSFSSITSGKLVAVAGRVSTSTMTINAVAVFVLPEMKNDHPMPPGIKNDHRMGSGTATGTATSTQKVTKGKVIQWLKGIIKREGPNRPNGEQNGEHAGAAAASAGIGAVLRAFFGWL